jgi:hypothetical protein
LANDQTLVQIRERSFLDLLDLALIVARRRPLPLAVSALLGIAPFAALNAWLVSLPSFPVGMLIYLWVLEAPWATAPLTVMLGGLMFGERPRAGRVLATLARSLPPMLVYQGLVRGLLLISGIFYVLVPTKLGFLNEVILLERGRWRDAVGRSSVLSRNRGGELFGQWLAQFFFGGIFALAFWLGTGAIGQALTKSDLTWEQPEWSDVLGVRFQLAVWLAIAFFAVARFLSYIDQRIRLEGWEIALRLRAVGKSLEDARRW